ncbi:MAG: hypothetical protein JST89_19290 [Cyanobacteria bacterium SZAS-4]|nr:hypothetical protein [Cyanobacteria bacterium SZAS-4]
MGNPAELPRNQEHKEPESHESVVGDFLHSAAYSAVQEPINGITQIADAVFHTKLLPQVQFISAPEQTQFGSANWHAQQVGGAVGMLLPFLAVGKGVRGLTGSASAAEAGLLSQPSMIGLTVKEAALTGFTYDALLKPSEYKEGSLASFLGSRALNGATGAATFTALSLSGIGLNGLAETKFAQQMKVSSFLKNEAVAGVLSGIPAGAVSAELHALQTGKPVPSWQDLGQSVYGFSMVGGFLGAGHSINRYAKSEAGRSTYEQLTTKIQDRVDQLKTSSTNAMDNIGNALFPNQVNSMMPAFAMAAGGRFEVSMPTRMSENLRPSTINGEPIPTVMKMEGSDGAGGGGGDGSGGRGGRGAPPLDVVRAKVEEIANVEHRINRNHDHQDYVQNHMRSMLNSLKAKGEVSKDWEVYPTEAGSPADSVGADYVLVNSRTGLFHMLDATSNDSKFNKPEDHNVSEMREQGLIYYEKPWFDEMGKLRTDQSEDATVREGVAQFNRDLKDQLVSLTHSPSLLNIAEAPFPSVVKLDDPTAKQIQINKFISWLEIKGNEASDPIDQHMFEDFAATLRRGAGKHADKTAATQFSPELNQRVEKAAEKVVVAVAVAAELGRAMEPSKTGASKSDVRHFQQENRVNLERDGVIYQSQNMDRVLMDARARMLRTDALEQVISKGQMNELRARYPNLSDERIVQRVSGRIVNLSNEISSGGLLANGRRPMVEEVVNRLRGSTAENLLGEEVHVQQAPKPEKIPNNVRKAATKFAEVWKEENLPEHTRGTEIDPDYVELVFDALMQGKQEAERGSLGALYEAYQKGDPVARRAIDEAISKP